MLREGCKQ